MPLSGMKGRRQVGDGCLIRDCSALNSSGSLDLNSAWPLPAFTHQLIVDDLGNDEFSKFLV